MKKPVILVVEGDEALQRRLRTRLLLEGFAVIHARDAFVPGQTVQTGRLGLVILCACTESPAEVFTKVRRIRKWPPGVPIILIASKSSEDLAIGALKRGVNDYFKIPLPLDELVASVKRCLFDARPRESHGSSARPHQCGAMPEMIGESQAMRQLGVYLLKVATVDSNVLITGETGTGKELVAQIIHRSSPRQAMPFLSVNCAAIPDSLLESELFGHEKGAFTGAQYSYAGKLKQADGGTVLLDEIGDISAYAQAKILRVIENKEMHGLGGERSTTATLCMTD